MILLPWSSSCHISHSLWSVASKHSPTLSNPVTGWTFGPPSQLQETSFLHLSDFPALLNSPSFLLPPVDMCIVSQVLSSALILNKLLPISYSCHSLTDGYYTAKIVRIYGACQSDSFDASLNCLAKNRYIYLFIRLLWCLHGPKN